MKKDKKEEYLIKITINVGKVFFAVATGRKEAMIMVLKEYQGEVWQIDMEVVTPIEEILE